MTPYFFYIFLFLKPVKHSTLLSVKKTDDKDLRDLLMKHNSKTKKAVGVGGR